MLTIFKEIFVWWNQQTLEQELYTIFFGKFVGRMIKAINIIKSKIRNRWVIYNDEIESTKITNEWYSWIHFMPNKNRKNKRYKNL